MTARDFAFWLQGYFEIVGEDTTVLTSNQIKIIKNHLNLVFTHEIDPSMGDAKHQQVLNEIHNPAPAWLSPHTIYDYDQANPNRPRC